MRATRIPIGLSVALLALTSCDGTSPHEPPPPAVFGTITGTIRDADGVILPGVVIRVAADGATAQQATSAEDGTFTFSEIRPGSWELIYDGSPDYASKSMLVDVKAGSTVNVTMVVVSLLGVVQGVILYNDTNEPAAGVRVSIGQRDTTTSTDGTFKFTRIAAGSLSIVVSPPPGYRGDTVAVAFNGSAVSVGAVTLVRVSGAVVGSVKSTNGGVSGVNVNLTHEESNTHQVAITQGDGSFIFAEVPLGTVRLTVDPTAEAFTVPVVVSLQQASVTAPAIAFLPRSALRPIAYVRCFQWYVDWDDNEICEQSQLTIANSDGTGERAVLQAPLENTRPSFSPDGQKLVFSRGGTLHTINVDGTGLVGMSQLTGMSSPVWSRDGSRILFAAGQLYFGSLPNFGTLTAVPNTEGATEPALSPDGSRIAFVTAGALKVVNADGSGLITLTSGIVWVGHPTWSPDGQKIAFTDGGTISITDAGGGNLISLGAGYCPEWSPAGSLIAAFGEPWPTQAPRTLDPIYLNGAVVASLHLPGAISCTHAWSPASALLP